MNDHDRRLSHVNADESESDTRPAYTAGVRLCRPCEFNFHSRLKISVVVVELIEAMKFCFKALQTSVHVRFTFFPSRWAGISTQTNVNVRT